MNLRRVIVPLILVVTSLCGCYISDSGDAGRACEGSECGCFDKKHMVFNGRVMDGTTFECLQYTLVRLRDRDGTVPQEDVSRSDGTYRVEGDVERAPRCVGGEPTVRDEVDPGQTPDFTYIPQRTPVSDGVEQIDFLRFPFGTLDAGHVVPPNPCLPRRDGGA